MIATHPLEEKHKSPEEIVVRRYFSEIVDGRSTDTLDELFQANCKIYRADRKQPILGIGELRRFVEMSLKTVPRIKTEILSLGVLENRDVFVHVRHRVEFGGFLSTPLGLCWAKGRSATWEAMAYFVVSDGRIAQERVIRDEIAILRQLRMVSYALARSGASLLEAAWSRAYYVFKS